MRRALLLAVLTSGLSAFAEPIVFEGTVPDGGAFFSLPFEVPAGTKEIEVRHDDLSSANILDFGLEDPARVRGWGGDNPEPTIVSELAASRGYLAGPIQAGTWSVTVGKAKLREFPARYRVEIDLRTAPTLAPQPERKPYVASAPLSTAARWYAGDFHVHSKESGDARPPLDEIATFARAQGLDFVAVSDHNIASHYDFFVDAQSRHRELLLVPSVEFTTYAGHGNAFGATAYVDHRLGFNGVTLPRALSAFAAQNAIFTINHPTLDIGSGCIGCAWEHTVPKTGIGAIEVGVGGWEGTGALFDDGAIAFWDRISDEGIHLAAVGGSDDHRAGVNLNQTQSPIGEPTTYVFARDLSVASLVEGIKAGRTVVKLRGVSDPFVTLEGSGTRQLDTVVGSLSSLRVEVAGGVGHSVRLVHNGAPLLLQTVDADPFVFETEVQAPETGADRYRAEVIVNGRVRTVTSHVWVSRTWPIEGKATLRTPVVPDDGCSSATGLLAATALLSVPGLYAQHRKRKRRNG